MIRLVGGEAVLQGGSSSTEGSSGSVMIQSSDVSSDKVHENGIISMSQDSLINCFQGRMLIFNIPSHPTTC